MIDLLKFHFLFNKLVKEMKHKLLNFMLFKKHKKMNYNLDI